MLFSSYPYSSEGRECRAQHETLLESIVHNQHIFSYVIRYDGLAGIILDSINGTARLVARQGQAVTSGTRGTRCTACASSGLGALPTQRYCTTEARTTYHGTMALSSTMQPHLILISSSSHAPAFRKEGPGTRMPTLRPKTWTPSRVGKSLRLPHTIKECIIEPHI